MSSARSSRRLPAERPDPPTAEGSEERLRGRDGQGIQQRKRGHEDFRLRAQARYRSRRRRHRGHGLLHQHERHGGGGTPAKTAGRARTFAEALGQDLALAPGSQVVAEYLEKSGLQKELDKIGFNLVGFGCTRCIGNSGPLAEEISESIANDVVAAAVLSGNRNFEGHVRRTAISPRRRWSIAYALAGNMGVDLARSPIGTDKKVYLRDTDQPRHCCRKSINKGVFARKYADVFKGEANWRKIAVKGGMNRPLDLRAEPADFQRDAEAADAGRAHCRCAHPRPVPRLLPPPPTTSRWVHQGGEPGGEYLRDRQVRPKTPTSGTRCGNHEVMMRGTFANIRIKNQMPGVEGGVTIHSPVEAR